MLSFFRLVTVRKFVSTLLRHVAGVDGGFSLTWVECECVLMGRWCDGPSSGRLGSVAEAAHWLWRTEHAAVCSQRLRTGIPQRYGSADQLRPRQGHRLPSYWYLHYTLSHLSCSRSADSIAYITLTAPKELFSTKCTLKVLNSTSLLSSSYSLSSFSC